MKRIVSGIMLTLLLLMGTLTLAFKIQQVKAEPRTWTVDDSGGADFTSIQSAIFAANPGDTIYVYNGTYYEHVYPASSLTIIGENKYATIIDASGWGINCVRMTILHNVKITGFTMRNADQTGINLWASYNNTIVGNIITNCTGGIAIDNSYNNTVADNIISNTTTIGVWLNCYNNIVRNNTLIGTIPPEPTDTIGIYLSDTPQNTHDNTILGNVISGNARGIYGGTLCYHNTIAGNTIENLTNYECGINIWGPDNRIVDNFISGMSYVGIQLNSISSDGLYGIPNACANNLVSGNVISNCTFGINLILAAFSNTVTRNNVSDNQLGILISDSSDNNIVINNFVSNSQDGILLFSSNNTKVYNNNFIDNAQQVVLSESFNTTWDLGYPFGGNYWSDYTGVDLRVGPFQNETGSDDIGDTPYVIDADNQDQYPLMASYPCIHAMSARDARPSKTVVGQGFGVKVYVDIANQGHFAETFNVTIYADTTEIETRKMTLSSGNSTTIAFTWSTPGFAYGDYTIVVNVSIVEGEKYTSDNTCCTTVHVSIPGNINGDGLVDVFDAVILAGAAGSTPDSSNWNPNADINNDLIVDLFDAVILSGHAGETET